MALLRSHAARFRPRVKLQGVKTRAAPPPTPPPRPRVTRSLTADDADDGADEPATRASASSRRSRTDHAHAPSRRWVSFGALALGAPSATRRADAVRHIHTTTENAQPRRPLGARRTLHTARTQLETPEHRRHRRQTPGPPPPPPPATHARPRRRETRDAPPVAVASTTATAAVPRPTQTAAGHLPRTWRTWTAIRATARRAISKRRALDERHGEPRAPGSRDAELKAIMRKAAGETTTHPRARRRRADARRCSPGTRGTLGRRAARRRAPRTAACASRRSRGATVRATAGARRASTSYSRRWPARPSTMAGACIMTASLGCALLGRVSDAAHGPRHLLTPLRPPQVRLAHLHLRARRGALAAAKCDGAAAAPRLRRLSDWRLPAALLGAGHLRKGALPLPPGLQRDVVRARRVDVVSRQLQRPRQMRWRILRVRPALLGVTLLSPSPPPPAGHADRSGRGHLGQLWLPTADERRLTKVAAAPRRAHAPCVYVYELPARMNVLALKAEPQCAPYTIGRGAIPLATPHTSPQTTHVTSRPAHHSPAAGRYAPCGRGPADYRAFKAMHVSCCGRPTAPPTRRRRTTSHPGGTFTERATPRCTGGRTRPAPPHSHPARLPLGCTGGRHTYVRTHFPFWNAGSGAGHICEHARRGDVLEPVGLDLGGANNAIALQNWGVTGWAAFRPNAASTHGKTLWCPVCCPSAC